MWHDTNFSALPNWKRSARHYECRSVRARLGYIRLSLRSATQPLYTMFPIIFSSCFSKVAIGFIPMLAGAAAVVQPADRVVSPRPAGSSSA
jgi:hypothetical protein